MVDEVVEEKVGRGTRREELGTEGDDAPNKKEDHRGPSPKKPPGPSASKCSHEAGGAGGRNPHNPHNPHRALTILGGRARQTPQGRERPGSTGG